MTSFYMSVILDWYGLNNLPAIETLKKDVKYVTDFTPLSSVSIVDFEHVNGCWASSETLKH